MTLQSRDIKDRFLSEQNYILRYVEFLHSASAVRDSDIAEISNILRRHQLPEIPQRENLSRWREPYSLEELDALVETLRAIMPDVDTKIANYQYQLDHLPVPKGLNKIDARSILGELIESVVEELEYDQSPQAIANIKQRVLDHQEQIIREYGDEAEPISPEDFDYAAQCALFIIVKKKLREMLYVRDRYIDLDLAARMIKPEAEINILRQAFILLLTTFDAAVFDLVRVAFTQNFFGLIGTFGSKDKISLEALARYGSFEKLRDEVIEEQLKARYLKDLLFILNSLGVQCLDETGRDCFIELVEFVIRRNVHVHNRGIVDERYLERDEQGTPRFNIYELALGSVAEINEAYWERTNKLCGLFVENLTVWVEMQDSGALSNP
jgi:hypothetical protein